MRSSKKMLSLAVLMLSFLSVALPCLAQEPDLLKFRAELSYVNASGNTEAQTLAGRLEAKREGPVNRLYLKGSLLWAASDSRETAHKYDVEGRWERVLTERTFGILMAGYIRDKFSGYSFRTYIGPGIGADFIKGEKHSLQGREALLFVHDEYAAGEKSTDNYLASRTSVKYEWEVLEDLKFSELLDYTFPVDELGRYFVDSLTSLDARMNSYLSMGVSYKVHYQHKPPSPEIKHMDTIFLTRLIVDF